MRGRLAALAPRDVVVATACGVLVGVCLSLGRAFFAAAGNLSFSEPSLWGRAFALALPATILFLCLFVASDAWARHRASRVSSRDGVHFASAGVRGALARPLVLRAVVAVVVCLLWLPAYLAFWPGGYASDGPMQIATLLNHGEVDLHWPAFHTLAMTALFQAGTALFGSHDAGLALLCAAQGVLLACALAYAAERLAAWGAPRPLVAGATLFVALNPAVQGYVFTTSKDVAFSAFFLLTCVMLADVARTRGTGLGPRRLAALVASCTLMCLLRKQGLYVLVASLPFLLPALRGVRPRAALAGAVALALALTFLFDAAVGWALPTRPDSPREMLSLPSQQVVRAYMLDHDGLDPRVLEEIGRYYDLGQLERGRTTTDPWQDQPGVGAYFDVGRGGAGYLEPIADPAKGALRDDALESDRLGYLRMWLDVARGHEGLYAEAFLWGMAGYVYPGAEAANFWTGLPRWNEFGMQLDPSLPGGQVSSYWQTSLLPAYRDWLVGVDDTFAAGMPALTPLVHMALPFYVLLASGALLVRSRRWALAAAWLVPALYWASLSLGPVACLRYAIPLFFALPLMACLPFVREAPVRLRYDAAKYDAAKRERNEAGAPAEGRVGACHE